MRQEVRNKLTAKAQQQAYLEQQQQQQQQQAALASQSRLPPQAGQGMALSNPPPSYQDSQSMPAHNGGSYDSPALPQDILEQSKLKAV